MHLASFHSQWLLFSFLLTWLITTILFASSVASVKFVVGTCGVGWSSVGSFDVMQDSSIQCSTHQSYVTVQDAGGTLSVAPQPSADKTDRHITSLVTDQVTANNFCDSSVQRDSMTVQSVHSASETSRRNSAAVGLNCSVVDAVSLNRCSKMQSSRRKSMGEAIVADFTVAGLHESDCDPSSLQCQKSAWRRTKSYDMSSYEVTVL